MNNHPAAIYHNEYEYIEYDKMGQDTYGGDLEENEKDKREFDEKKDKEDRDKFREKSKEWKRLAIGRRGTGGRNISSVEESNE